MRVVGGKRRRSCGDDGQAEREIPSPGQQQGTRSGPASTRSNLKYKQTIIANLRQRRHRSGRRKRGRLLLHRPPPLFSNLGGGGGGADKQGGHREVGEQGEHVGFTKQNLWTATIPSLPVSQTSVGAPAVASSSEPPSPFPGDQVAPFPARSAPA